LPTDELLADLEITSETLSNIPADIMEEMLLNLVLADTALFFKFLST
jgi:hypothetical protein